MATSATTGTMPESELWKIVTDEMVMNKAEKEAAGFAEYMKVRYGISDARPENHERHYASYKRYVGQKWMIMMRPPTAAVLLRDKRPVPVVIKSQRLTAAVLPQVVNQNLV